MSIADKMERYVADSQYFLMFVLYDKKKNR